jgi:hypothetical protein
MGASRLRLGRGFLSGVFLCPTTFKGGQDAMTEKKENEPEAGAAFTGYWTSDETAHAEDGHVFRDTIICSNSKKSCK